MPRRVRALRLSIYLGHAHVRHHKALSAQILHRAHHVGLAGATTLQGVQGFGHSTTIHSTAVWRLVDRTPVTVHIVDTPTRIRQFLATLDDLADECVIVCDPVEVIVEDDGPHRFAEHRQA